MQNGVVSGQRILISPARQAVRFGRSLLADVLPRPRRPPVFPPSPLRPSATAELRSCAQLSDSDVRKSSFAMSRPLADALPVRALPRNPALAFGCQDRLFRFVLPVLSERGEILGFRSCVYWVKTRRGGTTLPRQYSKPIYFSALMVELYTGLSSFYEIFNPWEMNLNIVSLHLPLLNFSETSHLRSFGG